MKDKAQTQGQVANDLDREHHQIARMNADRMRRKGAEKAFQKDELLYDHIVDHIGDGVYRINGNTPATKQQTAAPSPLAPG